jgi:DivIVA domain-containing protein
MAVSLQRPDPSSPDDVAAATFSVTRRGFDPTEVKDLLRMVAAELARLQDRERTLERELRAAQRPSTTTAVALDEEVVTRLLGEEAARILTTAREAAAQIKSRAEENAAQLLREASDEASRAREDASVEAARRRADANADAEAELEMAKQQGREMVNEARAYRERVLAELSRRRELARQQVDQLLHGRDRLLQAFERARLAAVDVMAEMTPLGEPAEYVNLDPITGPVPAMVPAATLSSSRATVIELPSPEPTAVDDANDDTDVDAGDDTDGDTDVDTLEVANDEGPVDAPTEVSNVVELFATTGDGPAADDVFARLRAARSQRVADAVNDTLEAPALEVEAEVEAPLDTPTEAPTSVFARTPEAPVASAELVDDTPFTQRDAALTPIIVAASRKLKRVLADEQNDVLAMLRSAQPVTAVDALLPAADDRRSRFVGAIADELHEAARAGASSVSERLTAAQQKQLGRSEVVQPAADAIAGDILGPLHDRVADAVAGADGDNAGLAEVVRALYREWKNQRIDDQLEHAVHLAFGRGALAALKPGTPVCWAVDPHGPPCPDAEDNSLGGVVGAGDPFPTGNTFAPAHEGCRCMLAPAPR